MTHEVVYVPSDPPRGERKAFTRLFLQSRGRRSKPFLEVYLAVVSPYVSRTANVYDDFES
jgi:hypothetical protein